MYLAFKSLHITAVLIFCSGLVAQTLVLLPSKTSGDTGVSQSARVIRDWDRWITSPALLIVWLAGLKLALVGDWFGAPWLWVKLGMVTALSAVHGVQSGRLRRLAGKEPSSGIGAVLSPYWFIGAFLIIAGLVVVKP